MRSIAVAKLTLGPISLCVVLVTQSALGDWPATPPASQLSAQPATFSGGIYSLTQLPPTPRTTYDDQRQSVYILDGPPAVASVLPIPNTPSFAAPAPAPAGIYQVAAIPPGQATARQAIYQPGQQFQLLDAAQPKSAAPVAYSTVEQPSLPPCECMPDCYDYS
ncbi:MAG TPA: hypothetical protein VGJ04_09920, partial [Pirellulales bacterium]